MASATKPCIEELADRIASHLDEEERSCIAERMRVSRTTPIPNSQDSFAIAVFGVDNLLRFGAWAVLPDVGLEQSEITQLNKKRRGSHSSGAAWNDLANALYDRLAGAGASSGN